MNHNKIIKLEDGAYETDKRIIIIQNGKEVTNIDDTGATYNHLNVSIQIDGKDIAKTILPKENTTTENGDVSSRFQKIYLTES